MPCLGTVLHYAWLWRINAFKTLKTPVIIACIANAIQPDVYKNDTSKTHPLQNRAKTK